MSLGFCYGGLSLEMEGKVKQLTQLGYLSVTTAGMGFGLLCITIASLVSKQTIEHEVCSVPCLDQVLH